MGSLFQAINENNKLSLNKPADSDVVYYSELNSWFTTNAFRSFSLKYVIDQCIHYKVGARHHDVNGGRFLLACKQPHVNAYFESPQTVKSVCIDICPATVAEAYTVLTAQGNADFDNYLTGYFKTPDFFEVVCPVQTAPFGQKLNELTNWVMTGRAADLIDKEWFLDLVEKIIYHEYGNYLALNGLHSTKLETRKEILRRLNTGKQYINELFLQVGDIREVAAACNMSEFHFFRSFKQAFGITPYQYILQKRLDLSKELIQQDEMSVTAIAAHCNFPDVFTFSKAFKRRFGVAPTRWKF